MPGREFDIIVYGITSFTGIRSLHYMDKMKTSTLKGLKFAVAGRSADKIKKVQDEAKTDYPVITAALDDDKALDAMCARATVLLSLAGPYSLYGMPVVDACVRQGTHWVDITGESPFVARTADKHHEEAQKKKIFICSQSAFDSEPPELVNMIIHRHAKDRGVDVKHVRVGWNILGGAGASGGTMASVMAIKDVMKKRDMNNPLSNLGDHPAEDLKGFMNPPGGFPRHGMVSIYQDPRFGSGYLAPFIMAGSNEKQVRKCNVLMGFNASYVECAITDSLVKAIIYSIVQFAAIILFIPVIGNLVYKLFMPKPGEGPKASAEAKTGFICRGCGFTDEQGRGEPSIRCLMNVPRGLGSGYHSAAYLSLETAAALVKKEFNPEATRKGSSWANGGVVTPVSVVGDALIRRLAHYGITFKVTTEKSWHEGSMQDVA